MKKIRYILQLILLLAVSSCNEEILNLKPLDQFSDADFWSDPNLAVTAVNNLYIYLTPDDAFHEWESYTENAIDGILWTPSHTLNQSGWTPGDADNYTRPWTNDGGIHGWTWVSQYFSTTWKTNYREIRSCNVVISNLGKVIGRTERQEQLLGEAKFMRAYLYHNLMRQFGGVIIIDHPLGLNDDVNLPRNTYKECADFVINDLNDAAAVLPKVWDNANKGRITSGAAKAMKGTVQLFAERWADAASTYQSVISEGTYSLFPDFQTMFFEENENNSEVVLDVQFKYPEFTFYGNSQALSGTQNGWAAGGPTQSLVDQFELLDGKAWNDPTSSYYNANDPYANRDKRFYATVQYDQGVYFGKRLETGIGLDGKGTLIKGADIEKNSDVTQTGYYLCKGIDTRGALKYNANAVLPAMGTNQIIIRYAEVLLSYAEAKNEATGPDQSVYNAVNVVRSRAGLPGLVTGLSKEQMRAKIRKERRVELCFEYNYFFDCLRWKDRSNFITKPKVAKIDYIYALDAAGVVKVDATSRKVVLSRSFSYANYSETRTFNLDTDFGWCLPIPQGEIDKNPNLVQNGAFSGNIKQ